MTDNTTQNQHKQKYASAIASARTVGETEFQAWFNRSSDVHQSIVRGFWDFTVHILTTAVCEQLVTPEEKIALEIGYGGGRILHAASHYFKGVIGVDIHNEQTTVEAFLKSQGQTNFQLFQTNGDTLPVDAESVDFVYSFIVLQHLPTFKVLESYIQETARVLKSGGVAQLYFGKFTQLSLINQLKYYQQGYHELGDVPVNHTSLVVRVATFKHLCQKNQLSVLAVGKSYKNVPDGFPDNIGGQNYITVVKA